MLTYEEPNTYRINNRKDFDPQIKLDSKCIKKCFDFADDMTFKQLGEHRDHRTGGGRRRKKAEIFADTFQGKIAEFGFYKFCTEKNAEISEIDMFVLGRGKWDLVDFRMNGRLVAVKSTKSYGNLLLLETGDWDDEGNYIPNRDRGSYRHDFIFLVRVSPSCSDILQRNDMLDSDDLDVKKAYELIAKEKWSVETTGYITHHEFVNDVIRGGQILPRHALLNGKYPGMDAENYYVEAGDLNFV